MASHCIVQFFENACFIVQFHALHYSNVKAYVKLRELLPFYTCYLALGNQMTLSNEVSEVAVQEAVNFIKTACQQTAFIAGKGLIDEKVGAYKAGT